MSSWTTPTTWADDTVLTAAQLNDELRDNPTYLYDGVLASPYKFAVRLQASSSGAWQIAGTNNYDITDAFVQCGVASISFVANNNTSVTVTLPTALTANNQAVVFATGETGAALASGIHFYAQVTSQTQITIYAWTVGGINLTQTLSVQWLVICR